MRPPKPGQEARASSDEGRSRIPLKPLYADSWKRTLVSDYRQQVVDVSGNGLTDLSPAVIWNRLTISLGTFARVTLPLEVAD